MLIWTAADILAAVQGQSLHEQNWRATGITIDSRSVNKGDLFIAIKGPHHDGHDYVAAAFQAGAAAAIVSRQVSPVPAAAPVIMVDDTVAALQALGRAGRARSSATIVAVTGSVGKTSCKEMLRLALGAVDSTHASIGSYNNHWGVPLSLARMPQDVRFGVFELGMNHAGELGPLSQMVRPDVAMITTIEPVHMAFFDSLDGIADAKAEIFQGLPSTGTAILNRDNAYYDRLLATAEKQGTKKILSFGKHAKADAQMISYTPTPDGAIVSARIIGTPVTFTLSVPGEHIAQNAISVLLTAVVAGGDLQVCAAALEAYRQPKGRGVIETIDLPAGGNFTLIDESYNASPTAVRFAARVLGQMVPQSGGRRIMVLGDMRELGQSGADYHRALATDITQAGIDVVYCCGELTHHLYEALPADLRGSWAEDSMTLAPIVSSAIQANDIVSVKGSLSMSMDTIVDLLSTNPATPTMHQSY
ncbi:MAG: UDP-N-acetylmuramoylalanyl-D-glutamyl-2,6-diaminopimelate--D-alanyl-D-alanine ligase [Alphaproteobacteria bacterium]|nr:UDP-N-acetylmuramoylalanyl-D-glutamyl-2,6-diaminopimelate--D-alanyl-D-alanine ligase [Alphaproteobacteria bacterium]MBV8547887.1 UDP-N-acetylmuramoylalanyl-D-glutamyl-2,6-diaminopimelate--D-alanyl-D-alanine ligase [Alphaproteobacteria bacterium]